jgi:hypothetical protein
MELYQKIILAILGILVLVSYAKYLPTGNYLTNPAWFGIKPDIVKIIICFQVLAVIGFLISIGSWMFVSQPEGGIMSKDNMLFYTLCAFFISAIGWSIGIYTKNTPLIVGSLIITAISSILLLAGSIEENNPKWYIFIGLLFLCITTVLGDGVVWNANYISKLSHDKPSFISKLDGTDKPNYENTHPAST